MIKEGEFIDIEYSRSTTGTGFLQLIVDKPADFDIESDSIYYYHNSNFTSVPLNKSLEDISAPASDVSLLPKYDLDFSKYTQFFSQFIFFIKNIFCIIMNKFYSPKIYQNHKKNHQLI